MAHDSYWRWAEAESAFCHLFPGGFKNAPLALGQALDAVGGNFFENGIDFLAEKFFRRQIFGHGVFSPAPQSRFLGGYLDQRPQRTALGTMEQRPFPMNGIANKNNSGEHATKMRGIRDMRASGGASGKDN